MDAQDIERIIQAEQTLARAHITMDIKTISQLLHQDYVIVQPGGKIETKADVLASYQIGNRHWDIAQVDQLEVKIYKDMGRVIGLWRGVGTNNGQAFNYQARFISIWVREDEDWENISYSSAEIE